MERPSKRARSLAALPTNSSKATGLGGQIARKPISTASGTTIRENIGSTLYGVMVIRRTSNSQRKPTIGTTLCRLPIPSLLGGKQRPQISAHSSQALRRPVAMAHGGRDFSDLPFDPSKSLQAINRHVNRAVQ